LEAFIDAVGQSKVFVREKSYRYYLGTQFRHRITRLEPQGEKVFPPTYEGGEYADEQKLVRIKDDKSGENVEVVQTFLLDSVQSQANRLELARLRAYDNRRIRMPLLQLVFGGDGADQTVQEIGRIAALEAAHRMCDAIFRDSNHNGVPFRQAAIGAALNNARTADATAVFGLCPTALLFGFWDSTGPCGGLGAKVQRALVSEIVGYQGVQKVVPISSDLDKSGKTFSRP
jgi:CRISPR-associated protein Csb1